MAASKVVETVILGAGTLIVIYYAVTHQDQLKMYFDKFIMSAQMQLGGSSTATGNNTAGGDNTPTTTTTPPASSTTTPIVNPGTNITGFPNTSPTPAVELPSPVRQPLPPSSTGPPATPPAPSGPPVSVGRLKAAFPNIPSKLLGTITPPSQANIDKTQMQTDAVANQLASTVLPPPPQALNQTVMAMMQQQTDAAANQLAGTIAPVDPGLVNNTGMPSVVGQNPQTTTGRNMKQMVKMAVPRVQTAAQKKQGQVTAAKQKGDIAVPATQAGPFCVCSTKGRWMGTGCNVANKFCTTAGQHGLGNQAVKVQVGK